MPSYFLKQPNGLLARFSTIPDHFTHVNLTAAEAFDVAFEEMGRHEAEQKIRRALDDDHLGEPWTGPADGLNRWRDSLETVEACHGSEELRKFLSEMEVKR